MGVEVNSTQSWHTPAPNESSRQLFHAAPKLPFRGLVTVLGQEPYSVTRGFIQTAAFDSGPLCMLLWGYWMTQLLF